MMRNKCSLVILSFLIVLSGCYLKLGISIEDNDNNKMIKMKVVEDSQNSLEIESLGRFAVQEHNKKENGVLEFVKVLKAREQVVAGKLYHLTLEAIEAGTTKIFQVKVWVKPWINFKQLQEFKHAPDFDILADSGR